MLALSIIKDVFLLTRLFVEQTLVLIQYYFDSHVESSLVNDYIGNFISLGVHCLFYQIMKSVEGTKNISH